MTFQFIDEDKTIKLTKDAPFMISSNLSSLESATDNLVSGAKEQYHKIFVGNKASEDKEALIGDEEPDEDITLQTEKTQTSNPVDVFSTGVDSQSHPDNSSVMTIPEYDAQKVEVIGFPSFTVPEANMDDIRENVEQRNDEDEFLVKFD